jgi:hypothetical protein
MTTNLKDTIALMEQKVVLFIKELLKTYASNGDYRYEVGKKIPRIGRVKVGDELTDYRFHGNGCTFWSNGDEIFFKYDYNLDQKNILFTIGGIHNFCKTHIPGYVMSDLDQNLERSLLVLKETDFFSTSDDDFSFNIIM